MHIIWKWGSSNFKAVAVLRFWRFSLLVVKSPCFFWWHHRSNRQCHTWTLSGFCETTPHYQSQLTRYGYDKVLKAFTLTIHSSDITTVYFFVPCHVPFTYILVFKEFHGRNTCVPLLRGSYKLHDCLLNEFLNFIGKLEVMQKMMF